MSGFGVDPTQQDPTQAPDPSQVFADPSQMPAMQGAQPQQGPEPGEPNEPPGVPAETLDAEINILEAIETGCEMCIAAGNVSAEDFMRFAQGVSFLATAIQALQPKPNPAAAQVASTAMRVDQQHAATMIKAAKDLHAAETQHNQQQQQAAQQDMPPHPAQQQVQGQQQQPGHAATAAFQHRQAPGPPSRPGQQPPSARG